MRDESMGRNLYRRRVAAKAGVVLLLAMLLLANLGPALAATPPTPEELWSSYEQPEIDYVPDEWHLVTGDPNAEHAVYDWPFPVQSIGHAIQSYQYYGGSPYFHHGVDIMAPAGTHVWTRSGGQIVNIENYQYGNPLYWEVAVLDPEGYLWQYHHIDEPTIPQAIWDAYSEYLVDPVNGGFVPPQTWIGDIIWWPVGYPGAPDNFHHIHLNILAEGAYVNGMEFHTDLPDPDSPEIAAIGLLQNGQIYPGDEIEGDYSLFVNTRELVMSDLYWLPPYEVTFSVDGGPVTTVWRFDDLPGGGDRYAYVTDYYVVPPTCGDYGCNDFWIDMGFIPDGQFDFPGTGGQHTVEVWSYDFAGNVTTDSFTYTVLADMGTHIGDLDGAVRVAPNGYWTAKVRIVVHDDNHDPLANATVTGTWSDGRPGTNVCTTDSRGRCFVLQRQHRNTLTVDFTVDDIAAAGYVYVPGDNHDPDGSSDGTTITITKP